MLRMLALSALLISVLGCGGLAPVPSPVLPPPHFAYSEPALEAMTGGTIPPDYPYAVYWMGFAQTDTSPATSYTISPALPAGLTLDAGNGVISGTPATAAPSGYYAVTASNAGGSVTSGLTLAVYAVGAPYHLSYPANPLTAAAGLPVTPDLPTMAGAASATFTVSPALPAGLGLDPATGAVTGTALAPTTTASYQVTATNAFGSAAISLQIAVSVPTAPVVSYPSGSMALVAGVPLASETPYCTALPAAVTFAITPALPAGLTLDPGKGTLSGTPTATSPLTMYEVSATNAVGTGQAAFSLSVNPAGWPLISGFWANPALLLPGQSTTLSWWTDGLSQVALNQVPLDPLLYDGAITLLPEPGTTLYTLTATNGMGTSSASLAVTVTPSAPLP